MDLTRYRSRAVALQLILVKHHIRFFFFAQQNLRSAAQDPALAADLADSRTWHRASPEGDFAAGH
jgi:hypothetical protein